MLKPKGVYRFGYPSNTPKVTILWAVRYAQVWRDLLKATRGS